jgi:hypothetical protein
MRYPDPRQPVEGGPRGLVQKPVTPDSMSAAPFYERPWRLKLDMPSDPEECECLERCQSELMHLLRALESYRFDH